MRTRVRRAVGVIALILGLAAVPSLSASAITGGEPDGNGHPSVGLILFYQPDGRFRCTATLVSPTVLVTAAHCTLGTKGKTLVTFDSVIAEQPPSPFPVAADPANGYTQAELEAAGYKSGTAYAHPEYSDFTDLDNWNDVGVIVLDRPVANITPAKIAPTNYLNAYQQPKLNSTIFTSVGYGTEVRKADSGPQKPTPMSYPLIRRVAQEPGQKLTPQILQVNGNEHDNRGTGGTCFGDSGGPTYHGGYVVTVTSYGYTQNCRYLDGLQRIDVPVVQNWLTTFPGVKIG
ncbi:V8-like Glu-specific endopeptidase [Kribbella sp. VKM Ac-2527]|uniref:V8-like Glu-specific endopeptidase n=1 Tax=Kribbella caucasensis TaxID=2512215 RepID=A0A4V3C5N9_9ACTN|nr:trypsin-like serine protease [Kribbella sp. VKM Ac-2527]TDO30608.1 V8-like Glu-specific endopeptidase [Kribbella sp. VKM Ac-2527]